MEDDEYDESPPVCDQEADYDDDEPPRKMAEAALRSPNFFDARFAAYRRPPPQSSEGASLNFMLIDAECISAKLRPDMDDPRARHSLKSDYCDSQEGGETWRCRYKRQREQIFNVPVIKLYGVLDGEASVCIDVYGFYPVFRLQVVAGTPSEDCMHRVRKYIEREVITQTGKRAMDVVDASVCRGYSAFPYSPAPSTFYEFKLSRPFVYKQLAQHFLRTPELDDAGSEGGVLGVVPHSADDALTQYMVSSGLRGFGWVAANEYGVRPPHDARRVEIERCTCTASSDCRQSGVTPIEDKDGIATLRILGIDIECIKDEGMPDARRNPVIIIGAVAAKAINGVVDPALTRNLVFSWYPSSGVPGVSNVEGACDVITAATETDMFMAFGAFLAAFDPDVYVGHNIVGFDIPYLVTRANELGVEEVMYMGRRRERTWRKPREIVRVRKNGDTRKSLRAETPGRIQLDTMTFIQGVRSESSYSLNSLSQKYLKASKDDVGYQMIKPLWLQSPDTRARLCAYCLKDVELSMGLATHGEFEMFLAIVELSRGTRVRASQLLRSGNQEKVKTLVLHQAKTPHFDAEGLCVFFPFETPKPRGKDDKFEGATVINPKRGVRSKNQPVAVGDFSSLYPSIMLSHNICYTTMLGVTKGELAPPNAPPHDTCPGVGTHFVHKDVRQGLLPRILDGLLSRRAQAKAMIKSDPDPAHKRMYDSRQLQLKIIANSVYGVLSASGGWFVRMEMGESVTAWGRSMIAKAMEIAKASPFNATIVYGDTDSIMMTYPGCTTVPDAFERLGRVCAAVTAAFPKPVSMAAEKVYEGHLQLGKKRYAGLCHLPGQKPKIDSKGVEKNRRDNTPLVRRMMGKIFELLFIDGDVDGALAFVHKSVADLIQGKIDFPDLVITKSLSKAEYKGRVAHYEVAKRMKERDSSYSMALGERIPFVIVCSQTGADKVCDKAEDPLWAIQHDMQIDVQHYISDISNPIARILMWYIAPRDMLDEVAALEAKLDDVVAKGDAVAEQITEKSIKKLIEKMTEHTAQRLFGPGATASIQRPPQKIAGPITKFFAKQKRARTPADFDRLEGLRAKLLAAKAKCTKCRGREDDSVACVQRDCTTLFEIALTTRDIEDFVSS